MPKLELTDKFCQAAKAGSGRKADYFDTTVKGLVLRVSAGGQKTWFVVYGPPNKRQWLKLGTYPETPARHRQGRSPQGQEHTCQRARRRRPRGRQEGACCLDDRLRSGRELSHPPSIIAAVGR
ncbi:MAG: DUF4102 domain-containing protein [Mesorhizobium sp.]|nr:MAG: DUF4102 domain-containing protein [Mesorhizobium sp.]